ncbi:hypothetical protein [Pragia fontium]|uniref:hypothetical protein n=1 Tax=Pragia fontium TaxID=82985 RepID=UPI00064A6B15|nr:hypothetical protein [Pragia fontium]AKJ41534.1 hypothetical protein QQ39_05095 [Pragia fontium]
MYLEDAWSLEKQEVMIAKLERVLSERGCSGLSQWEYDFINSLSRYFRRGKFITGSQKAASEKIISKYQVEGKKPNQGTLASETETVLAGERKR